MFDFGTVRLIMEAIGWLSCILSAALLFWALMEMLCDAVIALMDWLKRGCR